MNGYITFAEAVMEGIFEDVFVKLGHSGDIVYACPGVDLLLDPGDELHILYPNGFEEVITNPEGGVTMAPFYSGPMGKRISAE